MKKNIALITGGYSGESEISYKSAETIYQNLDKNLFEIYLIDITKAGWFYQLSKNEKIEINKQNFTLLIHQQIIKFDAAYIMVHGTPGEDGKLQSYFDMLNIPYTGCNAATSAVTFNKYYAVSIAQKSGIAVSKSIWLKKDYAVDLNCIADEFLFPVFVKPNNGGSSIGMSKINNKYDDFDKAIQKAFQEDDEIIIEQMVNGREFTVGVCQYNNSIVVLPITEVIINADKKFFDFEAKYKGKSTEITPAIIDNNILQKLQTEAKKIYTLFNCKGVVRIDFIYDIKEDTPYMLEINTVPGQSKESIIPQQVKKFGLSLKEFYTTLLNDVLQ